MKTTISEYFKNINRDDYQRENYDAFLKKVKFSFNLPSIHVAGTNGKGQTASFIASIYQKAGYKVGLFTSPYFHNPCESISVNGVIISESEALLLIDQQDKLFKKYKLSEFEILTFIAFEYFKKCQCDVVVIECGMGGLIDATNIFVPNLSIITSISMEHTYFLGDSLSEIAYQKAGIIKENIPVLTCEYHSDAFNVVSKVAYENNAKVIVLGEFTNAKFINNQYIFSYRKYNDITIQTPSLASVKDACFALEAVNILNDILPINDEDVYSGLSSYKAPCRMDVMSFNNLNIIIDGSHNPEAIKYLVNDVEIFSQNKPIHILFSRFKDKNIEYMLSFLNLLTNDITLTTFNHPRCRTEEEYFLYIDDYKYCDDYSLALQQYINEYPNDIILVTGSLAFAFLVKHEICKGKYVLLNEKPID